MAEERLGLAANTPESQSQLLLSGVSTETDSSGYRSTAIAPSPMRWSGKSHDRVGLRMTRIAVRTIRRPICELNYKKFMGRSPDGLTSARNLVERFFNKIKRCRHVWVPAFTGDRETARPAGKHQIAEA